jgi:hypothetical protein
MKTKILMLSLCLAAFSLTFSGCCSGEKKNENKETKAIAQAGYKCPMKCEGEKTYDKPGKCPKCGMDLEKLETAKKDSIKK